MQQHFLICLVQLFCLWNLLALSRVALEENKPFRSTASANHVVGVKKLAFCAAHSIDVS